MTFLVLSTGSADYIQPTGGVEISAKMVATQRRGRVLQRLDGVPKPISLLDELVDATAAGLRGVWSCPQGATETAMPPSTWPIL